MIIVYRDSDGWIEITDEYERGTWVHVESPVEEDIERLHEDLAIPRAFLNAALDPREVARTDSHRDSHLVIVRAPYDFGAKARVPFRTVPIAMITTPDHFVTICAYPIDFVRDLNFSFQEEELATHRAGRMILAILGVVAEWYLLYLEEIDRRLEDVENRLKDSIENSEMLELLGYEKSLVYIKTGLNWNTQMVDRLQGKTQFGWTEADQELFETVQVEYRQAFYMAETMVTVLEATTEAFASLISNNLNIVMKFMTSLTIILTVPMIVGSIYGMNVGLPGESRPFMFSVLMLLSLALSLVVAWWFQRRGWLSFHWRRPVENVVSPEGERA